jgi:hypothetical protein
LPPQIPRFQTSRREVRNGGIISDKRHVVGTALAPNGAKMTPRWNQKAAKDKPRAPKSSRQFAEMAHRAKTARGEVR